MLLLSMVELKFIKFLKPSFVLFFFVPVTSCIEADETPSPNDTIVECKDRLYLDNCLKKLPPILEKYEMKGIPSSKKDVDAACR